MKLYTYFRSSAAFRVRIALGLKGLDYDPVFIHLAEGGQRSAAYLEQNPQGLIPALETGGGIFGQSLAIIEYLEETHPQPPLLPGDPLDRARVRAMAGLIASDIHPLNNLRVMKYLGGPMGQGEEAIAVWYRHWIAEGFGALEELVARYGGGSPGSGYCFGGSVTMADCLLVPQMWNARRFQCDLRPFPGLVDIDARLQQIDAFRAAAPENQPDFPSE